MGDSHCALMQRSVRRLAALLVRVAPGAVLLLAANEAVGSVWSLAQIWLTKRLVDSIVAEAGGAGSMRGPLT